MKPKFIVGFALVVSGVLFGYAGTGVEAGAMDIINPKAPAGGRQIVVENINRELRAHQDTLGGLRLEDLTVGEPHREYCVTNLAMLASGQMLSATTSRSWRYLLRSEE